MSSKPPKTIKCSGTFTDSLGATLNVKALHLHVLDENGKGFGITLFCEHRKGCTFCVRLLSSITTLKDQLFSRVYQILYQLT